MERANQLELFSPGKVDFEKKSAPRAFLSYFRGYEKTIIIIICCIVIGVVSYSLGVEKGRNTAVVVAAPQRVQQPRLEAPAPKEKAQELNNSATGDSVDNYTIQVASYQSRVNAQKEAEILKKKGLLPLVLSKGAYTILCIGRFPNKEKAKISLAELKKKYKDCIIRRL